MANELVTTYDTALGPVSISPETVKKYLKRGNADLTDQEIFLFINLCKYQKLNPFTGEAYAIKFGSEFQMVVGYEKYKNRADENPNYLGREQGIVVQRGNEIVKKEGECLYTGEKLIGGWCKVHYVRNGREVVAYKEPSLSEYDKQQANWKTKPCMMIVKVAVSQALRDAFPKDFEGLYIAEEIKTIPAEYEEIKPQVETITDEPSTKEERQQILDEAKKKYGDRATGIIKIIKEDHGITSEFAKMTKLEAGMLMEAIMQDEAMEKPHEAMEKPHEAKRLDEQ
jgi:phage recombination protein Bet